MNFNSGSSLVGGIQSRGSSLLGPPGSVGRKREREGEWNESGQLQPSHSGFGICQGRGTTPWPRGGRCLSSTPLVAGSRPSGSR